MSTTTRRRFPVIVSATGTTWSVDHIGPCNYRRPESPPDANEVEIARQWFDRIAACDLVIQPRYPAYLAKHAVERAVGTYVSRGAAIVGAHLAGVTVAVSADGQRCRLGIGSRLARELEHGSDS